MGCEVLMEKLKLKVRRMGFDITNEMVTDSGCTFNFRDAAVRERVRPLVHDDTEADYFSTGAVSISNDGDIDVNLPVPIPEDSHVEWYIQPKGKESMYTPHVYRRNGITVFGMKGHGLNEEDLMNVLNAAITVRGKRVGK